MRSAIVGSPICSCRCATGNCEKEKAGSAYYFLAHDRSPWMRRPATRLEESRGHRCQFLLAPMSKPMAVSLPPILLLLDYRP